ncbi:mitochondrial inner membrane protease subunit 2 isoform X2 [Orussus abietinus]|uniref:mitochondrial inner membrane protease subunit 2 isoform X2 n=1 Tax=Orussus abietinus TaxID=222816 RepID=UPI000625F79F|nr:mitochondrial inner membrane protease subunit 2 isoform X2 [Orussus abietinus]
MCSVLLIGIPIGITFLDTVGYVARVEGVSMQPVLNPDLRQTDYVFLNRWQVRGYKVERGDVISLTSPKYPNQMLIKRVVAVAGDIVHTIGYKSEFLKVPDGHCWVEGDHTGQSMDSNCFGPISLGLVTAKATCIVWPPNRWQYLNSSLPDHRRPLNLRRTVTI